MSAYPHLECVPADAPAWFDALMRLARYLRSPDGCPWDRKQTCRDFVRFLAEEAEELREACEQDDNDAIEEEWGDTFFCALAAVAAAEHEGRFTLERALRRAHEKMIRRHAHVFGEHDAHTPEDAVKVWNEVKAKEKAKEKAGPQS